MLCDLWRRYWARRISTRAPTRPGRPAHRVIDPIIEAFEPDAGGDPEEHPARQAQKLGRSLPVYEVVDSGGPDHDPWYVVRVSVENVALAEGRGRSKRLAERAAARSAVAAGFDNGLHEATGPGDEA